jgi:methanogenic corrinoid protein MtbC1
LERGEKIRKSVLEGRPADAVTHTKGALSEGLSPKIILEQGLMPGIRKVGELFSEGEYLFAGTNGIRKSNGSSG